MRNQGLARTIAIFSFIYAARLFLSSLVADLEAFQWIFKTAYFVGLITFGVLILVKLKKHDNANPFILTIMVLFGFILLEAVILTLINKLDIFSFLGRITFALTPFILCLIYFCLERKRRLRIKAKLYHKRLEEEINETTANAFQNENDNSD